MIELYRAHRPDIRLAPNVMATLEELRRRAVDLALISDGSTRHQRAKIEALGLSEFFAPEAILISEETGGDKHTDIPWQRAEQLFGTDGRRFFYVGDNIAKDFRRPRMRGWHTVMLLNTANTNVFPQQPRDWPAECLPDTTLTDIADLLSFSTL